MAIVINKAVDLVRKKLSPSGPVCQNVNMLAKSDPIPCAKRDGITALCVAAAGIPKLEDPDSVLMVAGLVETLSKRVVQDVAYFVAHVVKADESTWTFADRLCKEANRFNSEYNHLVRELLAINPHGHYLSEFRADEDLTTPSRPAQPVQPDPPTNKVKP